MKIQLQNIPFFRRKFLREGLRKLHDTLAATALHNRYWICGGAVLGYAREGRLLKHDTDVDFHFWREDTDCFLRAVSQLEQVGFKRYVAWVNLNGEITEYVLRYKCIKFEFFAAERVNGNTRWQAYGETGTRRGAKEARRLMQLTCETPGCELAECEFLGRTWMKPADHEGYLTSLYGDWKTPDPAYHYMTDSKAVVKREPMPGKIERW